MKGSGDVGQHVRLLGKTWLAMTFLPVAGFLVLLVLVLGTRKLRAEGPWKSPSDG